MTADTALADFLTNRALAYGDGVFETILVRNGRAPFWPYHWQRLREGAECLQLDVPDEQAVRQAMADETGQESGVLKLVLFRQNEAHRRGYRPPGTASSYSMRFFSTDGVQAVTDKPLRLMVCSLRLSWQPMLAGIKHLNRLENVLASAQVQQNGMDDGLLLDADDNIIEATGSNVVFLRGRRLYTPALTRCGVYGVALRWLAAHFPVVTATMPIAAMGDFDALLLCNSVRGFRLVGQVAHHRFGIGRQKPEAQARISEIQDAWQEAVVSRCPLGLARR